jgi:arylsulfatase A-like enzyme
MKHGSLNALSLLVLGLFWPNAPFRGHAAQTPPPNIILMMADDMGMGDTSAYQDFTGNDDSVQVHTPNMDRLARMGVRFTDAHTPSSRCTTTRYSLLTGRYSWRSRMKHWVLFGAQGDPMIERDRPTIATMLHEAGYGTAIVGKWHVGLRFRQSDGRPAEGWKDADLTKPLYDSPLDHGFDFVRITSRSHGTSGPDAGNALGKGNGPNQNVGPGHIHGREVMAASGKGRSLMEESPDAYVLSKLGSRHSNSAMEFLTNHISGESSKDQPFFLYYPSNSNHAPYTPDTDISGNPVAGAARTVSGLPMDTRHDFIYENDVALGRLIDWLEETEDPRNPGHKLLDNTMVIFTSDNGAEKNSDTATGPFRSNKASVFEGGHRVPFIVAWKRGRVGDGDMRTSGKTSADLFALQDMFATLAAVVGSSLPDLAAGEKGAEDSFNVLPAMRGESLFQYPPVFFNDHKEAKDDPAVCAIRIDSPVVNGKVMDGQWKLFFDARLLREGKAQPFALYNLAEDRYENENLLERSDLAGLVQWISDRAATLRNLGGHRFEALSLGQRFNYDWRNNVQLAPGTNGRFILDKKDGLETLTMTIALERQGEWVRTFGFTKHADGFGVFGGRSMRVDDGEALIFRFDHDVLVESVSLVAGDGGRCGGYYTVGEHHPLAIYCVDADNDAKDQQGILSDLGVLKRGQPLRLDTRPHLGVEAPGDWRVAGLSVRTLKMDGQ